MGGAQPLAVTLNQGVCLIIDVDPERLERRGRAPVPGRGGRRPRRRHRPVRGGEGPALGDRSASSAIARPVLPSSCAGDSPSTVVTDQNERPRPALLPPRGVELSSGPTTRRPSPRSSRQGAGSRWPSTSRRWSPSKYAEVPRSSTTQLDQRPRPARAGSAGPSEIEGFVPLYIRPLFCEGRPVPVGGASLGTRRTSGHRQGGARTVPDNDHLHR